MSTATAFGPGPSAPAPGLTYVFSLRGELDAPVEQGHIDSRRRRFIPVTGGEVYGPKLQGRVLPGGGDWQAIGADGLTCVQARYFIQTADGANIGVTNTGVRTASSEVTERITQGVEVGPDEYYFRTNPVFEAPPGPYEWLRRRLFVARGIRKPDHVIVDFYVVD